MTKIQRKEILDDPNWIKFNPMIMGRKYQGDVINEHDSKTHLIIPKTYGKNKDVLMLECWTCRQIFFFHRQDNYDELRKLTSKEHWLYNDFPEEFQHLIIKGHA